MHPEIRQDEPGNCPQCGMTREPVMPTPDDDENPELADFTRRFWVSLLFPVLVMVLAMVGHRLALCRGDTQNWIELGLPVVLWAGWPFYLRGVKSVINRSPNRWTLIGLGTSVAFCYSLVATLAPQVFAAAFVVDGRVAVYFEAAAVIISLTLLGQMLRTAGALADLGGDQVAARPGAQDRAPHPGRRQRGGHAAVQRAGRRPAARASRREAAGRRCRRRRPQRGRRIDAHRRAPAGGASASATS
jgi:hypothetical protein